LLILPYFSSFGKVVSEEKILFRNQPIRNKNSLWWPCLLTDWDEMSNLNRKLPKDASYYVLIHLARRFQRRILLWKVLYKDCSFCPDPLTNMAATGNSCFWLTFFFKSSPLKSLSYYVLIHLARRFQRRILFRNQPIRNKNWLWRSCLLTDRK
jgi:hypothetical protein